MNKLLPSLRGLTQSARRAEQVCWPKPDYGPLEVMRSDLLNGIKVVTAKSLGAQIGACTVMFQAGSRYEEDVHIGATHFLRASTALSGCAYSGYMKTRFLQQEGAYLVCNSDRQTISFTLRCPLPLFVDLKYFLLDSAMRCYYKQVELEDIVMPLVRRDLASRPPEQHVIDLVQRACWAGPLSNSVYCEEERISGMTEAGLNCYVASQFQTSRCSLGGYGVPFEEVLKVAEAINIGRVAKPEERCDVVPRPRRGFEAFDLGAGSDTWIAVAVPGTGSCDLECVLQHAALVAACGVGATARGQHACDRAPHAPLGALAGDACTDYRAFNICYRDTGVFGILAKTRSQTARDVAFAAAEFLHNVGELSCEQIELGKKRLQVSLALHDDDCVKVSEGLALQAASGLQLDSAKDSMQMVACLSNEEISCTAKALAAKCCDMAYAVVGDVGAVPHDRELIC